MQRVKEWKEEHRDELLPRMRAYSAKWYAEVEGERRRKRKRKRTHPKVAKLKAKKKP